MLVFFNRLFFLIFLTCGFSLFSSSSFKVVTYNVLNDAFMDPSFYPHIDVTLLDREQRKFQIIKKILSLNADVICLQEVDSFMFELLNKELGPLGYQGARCEKKSDFDDNIVTFSKVGTLKLIKHQPVMCKNANDHSSNSLQPALVSFFRMQNDQKLIIFNTKIKWQKKYSKDSHDRAWNQLQYFFKEIVEKNKEAHFILVGDFNLCENEPVYEALIQKDFVDILSDSQDSTCFANHEWKRIDYIFYRGNLSFNGFILNDHKKQPIPNFNEPSDHLPVYGVFKEKS